MDGADETVSTAAGELREDIPLKPGKKSSNLCNCNEDCLGGSKFINVAFGSLTLIITTALLVQIYYGDYQVVPHGSVATDSRECSEIGTSILKIGGNSVDAAIASAFCLAVVTPHTTGLDAEGQILIYNHRTRLNPTVIDFNDINNTKSNNLLPRLVTGLIYVHQQYGTISWKQLVVPAVKIARKGFLVPRFLVSAIEKTQAINLWGHLEPGQIKKLDNLADTLENIANIPEEDLYEYVSNQPVENQSLLTSFYDYDVYLPNYASAGPALIDILLEIDKHNFTISDVTKPEYIYRIAEIIQTVYEKFNITTHFYQGTSSNVAVIDLDDDYVSLVTGMYDLFGSKQMTPGGYILDVKNKIYPSSRVPIIITDANFICGRRIVLGANDIALAAQLISSLIIAGDKPTVGIEAPRFHILNNDIIGIEDHIPAFNDDVLSYLETLSKINIMKEPYSSCNIVEKLKDDLSSHSDSRGGGIASRF